MLADVVGVSQLSKKTLRIDQMRGYLTMIAHRLS